MDIILSVLGMLLLLPAYVVIGLLIKFSDGGPIFFLQARPGLGGRYFKMIKFRTMHTDSPFRLRADPQMYALFLENDCKLPVEVDPRITPIGRILRTTSLDELPQFINILRGDMSLVGPRPIVGPEIEHYGDQALLFFSVKPGLTGYWQVHGRSTVPYPERAEMDLYYIEKQALHLDIQILFLTIPAVLSRRGAH